MLHLRFYRDIFEIKFAVTIHLNIFVPSYRENHFHLVIFTTVVLQKYELALISR